MSYVCRTCGGHTHQRTRGSNALFQSSALSTAPFHTSFPIHSIIVHGLLGYWCGAGPAIVAFPRFSKMLDDDDQFCPAWYPAPCRPSFGRVRGVRATRPYPGGESRGDDDADPAVVGSIVGGQGGVVDDHQGVWREGGARRVCWFWGAEKVGERG